MTKERELLRRALDRIDWVYPSDIALKHEIRAYLSNTSNDAEEPTKIEIAAEHEDIDWQSNEGAVYLFAGWLTTRDTVISCGRTENASPMAEAIKEYKAEWPERFTKPAEPAARKPMMEEEINKAYQIRFGEHNFVADFWEGVRFAEKHHGIGGDDDKQS